MGHAVHLSTLTQKGQITIPADIRHSLHMHTGDKVAIELVHGKVMLKKLEPFDYEYHQALSGTLSEWASKEDDDAYEDL